MRRIIAVLIVIGVNIGLLMGCSSNSNSVSNTAIQDNTCLIDVEKYGNISSEELIALIGEPNEISPSTCQGAFEIPCVYYEYSNSEIFGEASFVLVNDKVVRFTSYNEYPYTGKNNVFTQFGLTKEESCALAADTNVALRYRCPSSKVDDLWINLIDGDIFGFLQITYDMEYYEEWYLPLSSSEEIKYKSDAEETMKSLLTAPKTADFPWYDWQYGKNLFYILVSSYVDSQNAFGVEIRNTFTFVYSRLTGGIVLAIVNDEVVANNGYVAVDELIQQLYDETKKATTENNQSSPESSLTSNETRDPIQTTDTQSGNSENVSTTESVSSNTDSDKSVPHTHSYGAWKYYNESNHCQLCSSCNESKYETHKWNGGTTTKNSSCSQEGIITYSCSICNAEKKEAIPMKEHKWDGSKITRDATCSREGVITYFCSVCGSEKHENIPMNEHTWDDGTITQNPSCVQEGTIKYSCSVCATNTYDNIPKAAHSFNQKNESADYLKTNATYTSGSVYYYSCSCGEKGIETFTIDNKKEWISADQLKSAYGYSYSWMGEYLWLGRTDWDTKTDYNYQIFGSPKSSFDKDVIYTGSCNGFSVRFKYSQVTNYTSGNTFFYYDDLVAAGIISVLP